MQDPKSATTESVIGVALAEAVRAIAREFAS
jgi:hypothetical protein